MPLIVLFFIAMTAAANYLLAGRQQYVASTVIHYNNADAVNGLAPDGSEIDVGEISSSSNVKKAMNNLGLSIEDYSVDELRASISATPIVEEETAAIQTALNEQGEHYTEQPTDYRVTCTMGSDSSEDFVRNLLNEVLDVYFSEYGTQHISSPPLSNNVKGLMVKNYDYLEVVEKIESQLSEAINDLDRYIVSDPAFRSSRTGYSFEDIQKQFILFHDVSLYKLYSLILGNRITKDVGLLSARYLDTIADYTLDSQKAQEKLDDSEEIITSYVRKMRSSRNTNLNADFILDNVYDARRDTSGAQANAGSDTGFTDIDRSVEYDTLLQNWVTAKDDLDDAEIDIAYCQYILGVYQGTGKTGTAKDQIPSITGAGAQPLTSRTVTPVEIGTEIEALLAKIDALYTIIDETTAEYNDYLGAQNIQTLSSVIASPAINLRLYTMIVAAVFLIMGCCGAIFLGRIGDILEYVFLRDRQTGCMNRVSCDNHIQRLSKEILPGSFSCVNLQLKNQSELNAAVGREKSDEILMQIGQTLRDMFGNRKNGFVGYNGGGQFWAFYEGSGSETIGQELERLSIVMRDQFGAYPVTYELGGVNAGEMDVYLLRSLISISAISRKQHTLEQKQDG